jgi:flagellar biosynthesis protein FlhA
VEEIVPKILTIGEIQKVLSNLLKENVPIRDIVTILETLGDYATLTKDTDMLTEYVRQRLKRVITERFVMNKIAKVVTLDSQVEDIILDSIRQSEQGSYAAIEPSIIQKIRNSLVKIINDLNMKGISPIVLTSPMVRVYFKRIIEDYISFLPVLSYNELEPGVEVQSVGTVTL